MNLNYRIFVKNLRLQVEVLSRIFPECGTLEHLMCLAEPFCAVLSSSTCWEMSYEHSNNIEDSLAGSLHNFRFTNYKYHRPSVNECLFLVLLQYGSDVTALV